VVERKRARRFATVIGNEAVRKLVARSIQEIDYDVEAAGKFLIETKFKNVDSENAHAYAVQCFKDKHWLFADDSQGRLYHNVSQMARKLRPFASYKGKPLWMADVSCCQPCLLSLLYERDSEEKQRYIQIVKNSTFYLFLNERLTEPYDLSDEDSKRQFKEEVFHRIFYGSNWAKANELYQIFESEFPILVGLVRNAKWHHHRDLPVRLQTIEADVVINDVAAELASLHADEDFCLITIHDCLITTEEFVDECATHLRLGFKRCLGFEPTVKIKKITDPSILDQTNDFTEMCDDEQWSNRETDVLAA